MQQAVRFLPGALKNQLKTRRFWPINNRLILPGSMLVQVSEQRIKDHGSLHHIVIASSHGAIPPVPVPFDSGPELLGPTLKAWRQAWSARLGGSHHEGIEA